MTCVQLCCMYITNIAGVELTFQNFRCCLDTLTVLIYSELNDITTYYSCKPLLEYNNTTGCCSNNNLIPNWVSLK